MNSTIQSDIDQALIIPKCEDFEINGHGDNVQWAKMPWTEINAAENPENAYQTKFKMLYSETGVYILGRCEDELISTRYDMDQGDIWNGDVFEFFLQTDPFNPLYFEYEINQLNAELAILVPNHDGSFFGWAPWHYEGDRRIKKAVKIHGGTAAPGEKISAWTAEIFVPYKLFKALKNVPPTSGTEWKGNFYRMDYDSGERKIWAWKPIETSFHEYKKFGRLVFE